MILILSVLNKQIFKKKIRRLELFTFPYSSRAAEESKITLNLAFSQHTTVTRSLRPIWNEINYIYVLV